MRDASEPDEVWLTVAGHFWYGTKPRFELGPEVKLALIANRDVPDTGLDAEAMKAMAAAMARAGCVEVSLGFESGCPRVLRAMNKRFQPEEVREISERLAAHGIRRMGFLLLGGPGETKESADMSLAFARSLGLEMLKIPPSLPVPVEVPCVPPRRPLLCPALADSRVSNVAREIPETAGFNVGGASTNQLQQIMAKGLS